MPRRELLTSSEREELLAFPRDDGVLLRIATVCAEVATRAQRQVHRALTDEQRRNPAEVLEEVA